MKTNRETFHFIPFLLALAVTALFVTGCVGMRDKLYRPITTTIDVPQQVVTNYVTVRTNTVVVPATVDAQGNILTGEHTVERVEQLPAPVPYLTTNPPTTLVLTNGWEKRPEVFATAEVVGSAIPGWGSLAAGLFGAAGTIGAAWLNRKQKGTEAALVGTIQGIEQIRMALQKTPEGKKLDSAFVTALERAQRDHNAFDIVQRLLEIHTGYTKDQIDLSNIIKPPTTPGV